MGPIRKFYYCFFQRNEEAYQCREKFIFLSKVTGFRVINKHYMYIEMIQKKSIQTFPLCQPPWTTKCYNQTSSVENSPNLTIPEGPFFFHEQNQIDNRWTKGSNQSHLPIWPKQTFQKHGPFTGQNSKWQKYKHNTPIQHIRCSSEIVFLK